MTSTDLEDRLRRDLAAEAARTQASMLRPLTEPQGAPRRALAARGARRWLAPAAATVAVAAVVAGVTLAGSGLRGRPGTGARSGGTAAAPRFYASLTSPPLPVHVVIHDARTGHVVVSEPLPGTRGVAPEPSIAASANDRQFAIAATVHPAHAPSYVGLFYFSITSNGRGGALTSRGRLDLGAPGGFVDGIALSPDGKDLAVAVQIPSRGFHPRGEIEVITPGGRTETWAGGAGVPSDPAWLAGGPKLGFLWWDHLHGTALNFTARTRERVLDTNAPGNSLLRSSRVVAAAPGGAFLKSAVLTANGRTLFGTWYRNIAGTDGRGVAVVSLGRIGLHGQRSAVMLHRVIRYRGPLEKGAADSSCEVLSVTGQRNALAACPGLLRIEDGRIGTLPSLGPAPIVAW